MTSPAQPHKRDLSVRAFQAPPQSKRRTPRLAAAVERTQPLFEALEPRQLLSGHKLIAAPKVVHVTPAPPQDGYAPAQIRKAYGFDQVGLDGTGQTIAIVDAYNTAHIKQDLQVFDAQYNLPAVDLTVVNQTGGSTLPPTPDPFQSWSTETSLDVEWAHAIAPKAKILLVESRTQTIQNLMAAVNYARTVPGVSSISMSWGLVVNFAESPTQFNYDKIFQTPAGHTPITFVTASGDSSFMLPGFPDSSPYVLTVGGTSLITDAQPDGSGPGNYIREESWNSGPSQLFGGGTGGVSDIEPMPYYQKPILQAEAALGFNGIPRRAEPDVSYLGDPVSDNVPFNPGDPNAMPNPIPPSGTKPNGFAIYDADAGGVAGGWNTVGGTSAGSPQWAALIALANQQRVAGGKTTLDGFTETLPALYGVYRAPGSADFATYTNVFHDVDDGLTDKLPYPATPGYDLSTGLGSPKVPAVINTLFNATPAADTSFATPVGAPAASPAFISGTLLSAMPITVAPGDTVSLKVKLKNITNGLYNGPVTINVYTSTSPSSDTASAIAIVPIKKVKLGPGKSKKVSLKVGFPSNLPAGDYFFFITTDTSAVSTPSA
jgi:subtilase family serine protease